MISGPSLLLLKLIQRNVQFLRPGHDEPSVADDRSDHGAVRRVHQDLTELVVRDRNVRVRVRVCLHGIGGSLRGKFILARDDLLPVRVVQRMVLDRKSVV